MKAKFLSYSLAAAMLLGYAPRTFAQEHHHKSWSDALFAKKAAAGGLTEVELGKVAQQNGESQDVKDFGAKMVEDHGKANDQLKEIATKDSLTIPDKPNAEQREMIDKLTKESGAEFDKNYMHDMLVAHRKDEALFDKEAADGSNADLKKFASDTAVIVKEHLKMAEDIVHGMSGKTVGTAAESKSGPGPGGNASVPASSPEVTGGSSMPNNGTPDVGTSAESKSGNGPGGNANPVPTVTPPSPQ
jgi:putative membrane protein